MEDPSYNFINIEVQCNDSLESSHFFKKSHRNTHVVLDELLGDWRQFPTHIFTVNTFIFHKCTFSPSKSTSTVLFLHLLPFLVSLAISGLHCCPGVLERKSLSIIRAKPMLYINAVMTFERNTFYFGVNLAKFS
jgi:hypothetical protein